MVVEVGSRYTGGCWKLLHFHKSFQQGILRSSLVIVIYYKKLLGSYFVLA